MRTENSARVCAHICGRICAVIRAASALQFAQSFSTRTRARARAHAHAHAHTRTRTRAHHSVRTAHGARRRIFRATTHDATNSYRVRERDERLCKFRLSARDRRRSPAVPGRAGAKTHCECRRKCGGRTPPPRRGSIALWPRTGCESCGVPLPELRHVLWRKHVFYWRCNISRRRAN